MSKERSQLSPQRKEIIRPQVFDQEPEGFDHKSVFNRRALELVAILRKAIVEGVPPKGMPYINFSVSFEDEPYYTVQVEEDNSIRADIAYIRKRGDKAILHREKIVLNYDAKKVDKSEEFIDALKHGEIKSVFFVVDPKPVKGKKSIEIAPDGSLFLNGDILRWSKKEVAQRRRKLVEAKEYEIGSRLNRIADETVSIVREALEEQSGGIGGLKFLLDAPPYFRSEHGSGYYRFFISFAEQEDDKVKIHQEIIDVHYKYGEIEDEEGFRDAMEDGTLNHISCSLDASPRDPRNRFSARVRINPHTGGIALEDVAIPYWTKTSSE